MTASARSDGAASGRSHDSWIALALTTVALLVYANALHGEFVSDDTRLIVDNDVVKHPGNTWRIVSTGFPGLIGQASSSYRPLPPLVFMALHALFGLRPEPFHLVSLALHAATTWLVFLTARELLAGTRRGAQATQWAAFGAAAVFAAHPIHTEAVAWISGLTDLACGFFSLLALYLYVAGDEAERLGPRRVLSWGALLLGLLSKEAAAVIPFALVAHDLLFCRARVRTIAGAARRWGPPFAVLIAYVCVRGYVLGRFAPVRLDDARASADVVVATARAFAYSVQLLVVPLGQSVVHRLEPVTSVTSTRVGLPLAVIAAFGMLAWRALRSGSLAAFGMLALGMALIPSLYDAMPGRDASFAFTERSLYLPSIGAALALAAALAALEGTSRRLRTAASASVAGLVIVLGGMTVSRNAVWTDEVALWADCVEKDPNLGGARERLGLALMDRGRVEEARRQLQIVLRFDPDAARRHLDAGVLAARNGEVTQAIPSFQKAVLYRPDFVEAHYSLAVAFEQIGRNSAAIDEYRTTLRLDAGHAGAHNNLGIILAQTYRFDEAIDQFTAAVRSRPHDPELRLNLARAYEAKGLRREAQEQRSLANDGGKTRAW